MSKYTLSNSVYTFASVYSMTEEVDFAVYIPLNTAKEALKDYSRYFNAIKDVVDGIVDNYDTIKLSLDRIDLLKNGEYICTFDFNTYEDGVFEEDEDINIFYNMHYDIYKHLHNQFVEMSKKILAPYKEEEDEDGEYIDVYDAIEEDLEEDESEYEDESEEDLEEFFDELEKKREKFLW